jgi:thiamine biosynthesis lipoprotein
VTVSSAAWRAIGTEVVVLVDGGQLWRARAAVDSVIEAADRAYSRFRPDSELSGLAARPGEDVVVSPLLARAIEAALRGAQASNGLVDPTVGRVLRLSGYDGDFSFVATRAHPIVVHIEAVPGWKALSWDASRRRIRVPAGVELDFGSTGKALIADLAVEAASTAAGPEACVLVSVGGDIALAGPAPAEGWRVLMAEDSTTPPDAAGEIAVLREGALATSSTTVRRWRCGETVVHHIIDPRTGLPADGPWRTASVIAASCVDANIAATAAIVLGAEAVGWLTARGLPARLVSADGDVLRVGDWPEAAESATARQAGAAQPAA